MERLIVGFVICTIFLTTGIAIWLIPPVDEYTAFNYIINSLVSLFSLGGIYMVISCYLDKRRPKE